MKIGQALSARPDLLPRTYLEALSELQDRLPSFPTEIAFAVRGARGGVEGPGWDGWGGRGLEGRHRGAGLLHWSRVGARGERRVSARWVEGLGGRISDHDT